MNRGPENVDDDQDAAGFRNVDAAREKNIDEAMQICLKKRLSDK